MQNNQTTPSTDSSPRVENKKSTPLPVLPPRVENQNNNKDKTLPSSLDNNMSSAQNTPFIPNDDVDVPITPTNTIPDTLLRVSRNKLPILHHIPPDETTTSSYSSPPSFPSDKPHLIPDDDDMDLPPEPPRYNLQIRQPVSYKHQAAQFLIAQELFLPNINHIYDDSGKK